MTQAPPSSSAEPTWENRFLEILQNRDKSRTDGFVVAVRGTTSLAAVQDLCHDPTRQNWNVCLTARYRLREPSLGTLLAAFVSDLTAESAPNPMFQRPATKGAELGEWNRTIGDVREDPGSGGEGWQRLRNHPRIAELTAAVWERSSGAISRTWRNALFSAVDEALASGQRLMLLVELERGDDEWLDMLPRRPVPMRSRPREYLFALPERFGMVLTTPRPVFEFGTINLEVPATAPAGVHADYLDAPLTGDQLADVDTLDRRWYAAALANLVMLPDTGPMTIGVHARWGVGKSSFMRFIRWELLRDAMADRPQELADLDRADERVEATAAALRESDAHNARALAAARKRFADAVAERGRALAKLERAAADTVLCVRFNAWLYEGATQIWAGLTHEITRAMEDSLPWWRRLTTRVRYTLHEHGVGFWVGAAAGVAAAVLLAGLALVLGFGNAGSALARSLPPGLDVVAKLLPTGSVLAVGLLLAWRLSRGFVPVSGRVAQYLRRPDYRVQMGYQHQLRRDIEFLKARLRRGDRAPRVVVFIDDLDRCSDERVLETLQAINLLLTESGFYVFLGIDTEMIINAIERQYHVGTKEPDEDVARRARSYLDKILQLNVPLREPDANRSFAFLAGFFSPQARLEHERRAQAGSPEAGDVEDELFEPVDGGELRWDRSLVSAPPEQGQDFQVRQVEDTADELAAFEELREYLPDNPRELKRLVNIHRLIRLLARQSNWRPSAGERRLIVGWLLLCFKRPDIAEQLVNAARENPETAVLVFDEETQVFLGSAENADLTAAQLAPGTPLGEAWEISALFRRHAATND